MPQATDLVLYMAENSPDDDTSTASGIIRDTLHASGARIGEMTPIAGTDNIEVLSSGAGDTGRTVTVEGRDAGGAVITAGPSTLTGQTPVTMTGPFERVLRVTLSALNGTDTVTVRDATTDATIATLGPNVTEVIRFFRKGSSSGSPETRYETCYFRNNHATESLTSANVQINESANPGVNLLMAIASTVNVDLATTTNRQTVPVGIGSFVDDGLDQAVPGGGTLAAGQRVAIVVRQDLNASAAAQKNTFTLQITGNSV